MKNALIQTIKEKSKLVSKDVQHFREHLHQFPELSFQEFETQKFILETLTSFGFKDAKAIGTTGVVLVISPDSIPNPNKCFAIRADIDALPIQENSSKWYTSKKSGIMHACGHDVHTSILLGVAKVLFDLRNELPQAIKLIFQPGEEQSPGGASILIKEGVLKNPMVERIVALHVYPEMEAGKVGFKEGIYMASCDEIHIDIIGKGGHGALPNTTIDPIAIGASLIINLQQLVSRKCDPKTPCVLSFGRFEALGSTNVIPEKAILKGTFRTMSEVWRKEALLFIQNVTISHCESFGAKSEVKIVAGYPFLENDLHLTQEFRKATNLILGNDKIEDLPIRMTAEDFSFYAQEIPACLMRLGVRDEDNEIIYSVHNSKFDVSPSCFETGVACFLGMCFALEKV